ncbi:MAG TPA: Ig-like domain-containing protein [Terriglobales bacterium]|nr:Ig-like domain-containing protein [Terriglobales bacterium]
MKRTRVILAVVVIATTIAGIAAGGSAKAGHPNATPTPTSTSSYAVDIRSPANGATVSGTVVITLKTSSSVAWADVFTDGTLLASSSPYTFNWNSASVWFSWNTATVANGTHAISASAFDRTGAQIGSDSIDVTVGNPTAAVTSSAIPIPRPTPPPLVNPQNPVAYGADPTGAHNSAAAFQRAINVGDLYVPPGLFRIDSPVTVSDNRNIRCKSGAAIEMTTRGNLAMFKWNGSTGGSVFNCCFRGNNYKVNRKPATSNVFQEFLYIQSISGHGGGLTIANNDFNGIGGWVGAISIYGSDSNQPGPRNNLITYNSFEHCGLYAVQLTSGKGNRISHNTLNDCDGFVEADNLGQLNTGNVIDHNTLTFVYGVGQWGPGLPAYNELSCGASPSRFNYSGNICSNNTVSGTSSYILEHGLPNTVPALYINNICGGGCVVW